MNAIKSKEQVCKVDVNDLLHDKQLIKFMSFTNFIDPLYRIVFKFIKRLVMKD